MTTIDPSMLDAIRVVVNEVVTEVVRPLDDRLGRVEAQQQAQNVKIDRIEAEQRAQRSVLHSIETMIDERFAHLEERFTMLEAEVGRIEARAVRLSSDLLDLTDKVAELTERVAEGFQTFKREVAQAFRDIGATQNAQQRYGRQISELRERIELLERRINRLEDQAGGVI